MSRSAHQVVTNSRDEGIGKSEFRNQGGKIMETYRQDIMRISQSFKHYLEILTELNFSIVALGQQRASVQRNKGTYFTRLHFSEQG